MAERAIATAIEANEEPRKREVKQPLNRHKTAQRYYSRFELRTTNRK